MLLFSYPLLRWRKSWVQYMIRGKCWSFLCDAVKNVVIDAKLGRFIIFLHNNNGCAKGLLDFCPFLLLLEEVVLPCEFFVLSNSLFKVATLREFRCKPTSYLFVFTSYFIFSSIYFDLFHSSH